MPPFFVFGESNVDRMDEARRGAAREVALAEGTELEAEDWRRLFGTAKPPKTETDRKASGKLRYGAERRHVYNPLTELVEEHEVYFSSAAAGEDGRAVLGVVDLKQFRRNRVYDNVYEPDGTLALVPTGGGVRFFMLALHERDVVRRAELLLRRAALTRVSPAAGPPHGGASSCIDPRGHRRMGRRTQRPARAPQGVTCCSALERRDGRWAWRAPF